MQYKSKLLTCASIGGHWVQLQRIVNGLKDDYEISFVSSNEKCRSSVEGHPFYHIRDFTRKNPWWIIPNFFKCLYIIIKEKPKAVITTGSAPCLLCVLAARLLGKKTVWIDSIANVERLSTSGKIASKIASRIYTQWPDLADDKIKYAGNILG